VHARLQVSVCSGYSLVTSWLASRHTHTDRQVLVSLYAKNNDSDIEQVSKY